MTRLIARDDGPAEGRRAFLRAAGAFAAATLAPGVTLYAFGGSAPAGAGARRAGVGEGPLGDADRHQQVRRRLRQVRDGLPRRERMGRLGQSRNRRAMDPQGLPARPEDRLERRSAGHVPALRRSALRRGLPDRRVVQAGRRDRARRQAHLHRLPLLHDGLPLQGAVLRARTDRRPEALGAARQGHGRELHLVRPPRSTRAASRPASRPARRKAAAP